MRILFLCGSLEPGRDGVGDYTRSLAGECVRQGHESALVALNDRHLTSPLEESLRVTLALGEEIESSVSPADSTFIPALRLPSAMSWPDRIMQAKVFSDRFNPEWVSLQFVCYTFDPKGVVRGLYPRLRPLLEGRKLHMMFHEAWLCKEQGFGWKQRFVGQLQRYFIRRFVKAARPAVVHTSNASYVSLLSRAGIRATVLGMFGSVPIRKEPASGWLHQQLCANLGSGYEREKWLLFGFFGALYPGWPAEPLFTQVQQAAKATGKKVAILSIGRVGYEELWDGLVREYSDRFAFVRLGEQPVEHISEYLSDLDYGLATSQWGMIGKSSTTASMLEHGLPVVVNRIDTSLEVINKGPADPLLLRCDGQLPMRLVAGYPKGSRNSRLEPTTRLFISDLRGVQT